MSIKRIGVIGVGQIGSRHLDNYAKIPGVEIVAVADVNEAALGHAAANHNVPHTFTKFRDLLAMDEIDAVDVCLHNNLHAPVSIAVMESGKHCFCEKPIAGSYADGLAMVQASQRTGRMLSVQLAKLFSRDTRLAKRLIDGGMIGTPYHARAAGFRRRGRPFVDGYGTASFVQRRIAAGGALFDMGVYHISRALYLLGQPAVVSLTGKRHQHTPMDARRRDSSGYDVEELGLGFARLEGGVTLEIAESWAIYLDGFGPSYVVGDRGGLKLEPLSYHATVCDIEMNATFDEAESDFRLHQTEDDGDAYDSPQHHWVAALQGRVPLLPTADIALQTILISEGIYLSDALGREVTVSEIAAQSRSSAMAIEEIC